MEFSTSVIALEQLVESVQRAVRRSDVKQLEQLLVEITEVWNSGSWNNPEQKAYALGVQTTLERVINFALSRARGDEAVDLMKDQLAKTVLRFLGKWARNCCKNNYPKLIPFSHLVPALYADSRKLDQIVDRLQRLDLINVVAINDHRQVEITTNGVNLLEVTCPGWQVKPLYVDNLTCLWNESQC